MRLEYLFSTIPTLGCIPPPGFFVGQTDYLGSPFEIQLEATDLIGNESIKYYIDVRITENQKPEIAFEDYGNLTTLAHQEKEINACSSYDPDFDNSTFSGLNYEWHFVNGDESTLIVGEDRCYLKVKHTIPGVYQYKLYVSDSYGATQDGDFYVNVEQFPPHGTYYPPEFATKSEFDFSEEWSYTFTKYSPEISVIRENVPYFDDGIRYSIKLGIKYNFLVIQEGLVTTLNSVEELDSLVSLKLQSESEFDVEVLFKPELVLNWNFCNFYGNQCNGGEIGIGLPSFEEVYEGQTYYQIKGYGIYFWDEFRKIDFSEAADIDEFTYKAERSIDIFEINLWDVIQFLYNVPDFEFTYESESDLISLEASIGFNINIPLRYSLGVGLEIENRLNLLSYTQTDNDVIENLIQSSISSSEGDDSYFEATTQKQDIPASIVVIPFIESRSRLSLSGFLTIDFIVDITAEAQWDLPSSYLDGSASESATLYDAGGPFTVMGGIGSESRGTYKLEQVNPAIVWKEELVEQTEDSSVTSLSSEAVVIAATSISAICVLVLCVIIVRRLRSTGDEEDYDDEYDSEYNFEPHTDDYSAMAQLTPDYELKGSIHETGYEVIEYPNGSEQWWWKDTENQCWVIWE